MYILLNTVYCYIFLAIFNTRGFLLLRNYISAAILIDETSFLFILLPSKVS